MDEKLTDQQREFLTAYLRLSPRNRELLRQQIIIAAHSEAWGRFWRFGGVNPDPETGK